MHTHVHTHAHMYTHSPPVVIFTLLPGPRPAWASVPEPAVLCPRMYWCPVTYRGKAHPKSWGRQLGFLGAMTQLLSWVLTFAHWSPMAADSFDRSVAGRVRLLSGTGLVLIPLLLLLSCGQVPYPFSDYYLHPGVAVRIEDMIHIKKCFSALRNKGAIWGSYCNAHF